jgi:hypothetical protein
VARVANAVESAHALEARMDDAFVVYSRLEHVHQATVAHARMVVDVIGPPDPTTTVGKLEQRNSRAYELFKDMVDGNSNLDHSSRERMLHQCREYLNITPPVEPRNNDDE